MNINIREIVQKAMADSIKSIVDKKCKTDDDVMWLTSLYTEMKNSLKRLTPRRYDLHNELENALDVNLFEQMVRHDALVIGDIYPIVDFVFERLLQLCAPSQDAHVRDLHNGLRIETESGVLISMFLTHVHSIIAEIEHLQHQFLAGTSEDDDRST